MNNAVGLFLVRTRWLWLGSFALLNVAMLWYLHDQILHGYGDFSALYRAGEIVRSGQAAHLYDPALQWNLPHQFWRGPLPLPFIHPPFEALIFWPLSSLTYRNAFFVWDAVCLSMLLGTGITLRSCIAEFRGVALWKFMVCGLAFFPVFMCLLEGQDSILQLLCCTLALRAMKRESDALAGCWLALASFKFQFTVPIIALFFLWRRRRLVLGFLPLILVLVLVSLEISGLRSFIDYPEFALRVVETKRLGGVPLSLLPNLHGLVVGWSAIPKGWPAMALALAASASLFGIAAARGGMADGLSGDDFDLQFSLAVVVAVLVAWQTNIHDLSLLSLPLVLLISYGLRNRDSERSTFHLLFPALPLLVSPLWMILWLPLGRVNLVAIPMIWWAWKIGEELSGGARNVTAPT
jgi:glycosyl transferase family 87